MLQCTYPVQFIVPVSANKQNNKAATNKPEEKQVQFKERIYGHLDISYSRKSLSFEF